MTAPLAGCCVSARSEAAVPAEFPVLIFPAAAKAQIDPKPPKTTGRFRAG